MDKRQAAMIVGIKDDKILILRRSYKEKWMSGRWNLPGGSVQDKETPENAVKRECLEECGLIPINIKLLIKLEKSHVILWVYQGTLPEQQILLDPREVSDYSWINKDTINNFEFVPDCKNFILTVLQC